MNTNLHDDTSRQFADITKLLFLLLCCVVWSTNQHNTVLVTRKLTCAVYSFYLFRLNIGYRIKKQIKKNLCIKVILYRLGHHCCSSIKITVIGDQEWESVKLCAFFFLKHELNPLQRFHFEISLNI